MSFATLRTADGTRAARLDADRYVLLDAVDVGDLLRRGVSQVSETGETVPRAEADLVSVITAPRKVFCVGLNYVSHLREVNADQPLPTYPTLFAKFADTLTGPFDDIAIPAPELSDTIDWEAELVVVVGRPLYRADEATALEAIGGYTIANDISMRQWQLRSSEWLQGKAWDATTPLGPVLALPEEVDHARGLTITCTVNGEEKQRGNTSDLLFGPAKVLSYISTFTHLEPGDIVLTGTTGGVGFVSGNRTLLQPGDVVTVAIEGIGELRNRIVAEG